MIFNDKQSEIRKGVIDKDIVSLCKKNKIAVIVKHIVNEKSLSTNVNCAGRAVKYVHHLKVNVESIILFKVLEYIHVLSKNSTERTKQAQQFLSTC